MRQDRQTPGQLSGGLGFLQRGNQINQSAVVHPPAALGSRNSQANRQMGLTHARWPKQDDVLLAVDEDELMQALDLLPLDRLIQVWKERSNNSKVLTTGN